MIAKKIMKLTAITLVIMVTVAESKLYSQCYQEGYCFYTRGEPTTQEARKGFSKECQGMNRQARVLELHDRSMQTNFESFLTTNSLKLDNVLINLLRVDQPWTWLDGTNYTADNSPANVKEYFIDVMSEPFASVNRLSMKILSDPNPVVKSHLSELDKFLCSFKGPCNGSQWKDKFQVKEMCYTFHSRKGVNWMEAYTDCSDRQSSLALIPPHLLQHFKIEAKNVLEVDHPYWIGLSKITWQWHSRPGQPIDFFNWYNGYPDPRLINEEPSKVFASVQPNSGNIWMDNDKLTNVILVCMTKASDEGWNRDDDDDEDDVPLSPRKEHSNHQDTYTVAKAAIIAVPVVLVVLLIASLVANAVLAVLLWRRGKETKPEERQVVNEYFHYE